MADILFINPPVNFAIPSDYKMDYPITGPLVLASICESRGYSVVFFDNRDRFWTLDQLTRKIEQRILKKKLNAIKSTDVGQVVLQELKKFDKMAYLRYATVYKSLDDPELLKKELLKMQ